MGQARLHLSINNLWLLFAGQAMPHFSVNNLWLLFAGPSRMRLLHLLPVCTGAAAWARALAWLKSRRITQHWGICQR
jgi:hypothetical protein